MINLNEQVQNREIRIFVSSTFRDMAQERDLLVKGVFPELRRLCAKRFVTFTEVDLRWGITEEQAAEGKVLPLCLEEIHRCRPYFIAFLGERYGWVPDSIPAEVIEKEPWLREYLQDQRSVTEFEILHGVLNDPEMRNHAYFYFRDPQWIDSLPATERREMLEYDVPDEVERFGAREASRRTADRRHKLSTLKDRIRRDGYHVVEDYSDPKALADAIRDQLLQLINQLYPEADVPAALDREALAHAAYAESKTFACIRRPVHQAVLDRYADSERDLKGMAVIGSSGIGKTSLLAMWSGDRAKQHQDDFIFQHFFGATAISGSVDEFLRRLLGELKGRFQIEGDIPQESGQLRETLPIWLAETRGSGRIILVLDGLDQIGGSESDRHLAWLPIVFHPHITVVASSLAGPALDTLSQRGWYLHELPFTEEGEIADMIDTYLVEFRKTLDPKLRRLLIEAKGSRNSLFLRTVLEELRQFGSFEKLPARLSHYLDADDPLELFRRVIRRWQEDFDAGKDLTRRTLCHLWAARKGLSESECLDLLGDGDALPRAVWTPLFLAMESHLCDQVGLLAFAHDFLRQATASEFLPTDVDRRNAHRVLAEYFGARTEIGLRKYVEWPWQLQEAEQWDRLQKALSDRQLFETLFEDQVDGGLGAYWLRLREARPSLQMGRHYSDAFTAWLEEEREPERIKLLAERLGRFLQASGLYEESEPLLRRALALCEQVHGPDSIEFSVSLNVLATILHDTNRLTEAESLYRRSLKIYEEHDGPGHFLVAISLHNLAGLLQDMNRLSEAEPLIRRALRISELHFGLEHPLVADSLSSLAKLLRNTNRLEEAETLTRRALAVCEKSLGPSHPSVGTPLIALAGLLISSNRHAEAEPLIRRALKNYERSVGPDHPYVARTLNNLVGVLSATGRPAEAEPLARRALKIKQCSLGPNHPDVAFSLNNLAALLLTMKRPVEAEPLMRKQLEIFISSSRGATGSHPQVAAAVRNYAAVLAALGWNQERIRSHLEALAQDLS